MEKGNNKNTWIWVVVIVLVVIGVVVAVKMNKSGSDAYMTDNTGTQPATPDAVQASEDVSAGSIDAPASPTGTAVTISYEDALVKYKDSRIQLGTGASCAATPTTVTYKNGTVIMIDNRSPEARTLHIGGDYTVKGYGFKLIKLSSATLPATWLVDCDGQQNVATILLQK